MICYRDRTFCASPGCRNECGHQPPPTLQEDALAWWGKPNPPIAWAWFCDDDGSRIVSTSGEAPDA